MVAVPVEDVEAAVQRWGIWGARVLKRDGNRFALLDLAGASVALCGPDDPNRPAAVSLVLEVDSLDQPLGAAVTTGASVIDDRDYRGRRQVVLRAADPLDVIVTERGELP
jgi:hypothetical protein